MYFKKHLPKKIYFEKYDFEEIYFEKYIVGGIYFETQSNKKKLPQKKLLRKTSTRRKNLLRNTP